MPFLVLLTQKNLITTDLIKPTDFYQLSCNPLTCACTHTHTHKKHTHKTSLKDEKIKFENKNKQESDIIILQQCIPVILCLVAELWLGPRNGSTWANTCPFTLLPGLKIKISHTKIIK